MNTSSIVGSLTPELREGASEADAARAFEGMLVKELLGSVRRSTGGEGALGAGPFADVIDEMLATAVSESGGFGLAEQLGFAGPAPAPAPRAAAAAGYRTTSGFGERSDPFDGSRKRHAGVDLGAPTGTPIRAARGGEVTFAGEAGGYGNLVVVRHADGLETRYAHCSSLGVKVGDAVEPGEVIAAVGSTGRATGPHLHFEVRENGRAVDPSAWIVDGLPLGPKVEPAGSENLTGTGAIDAGPRSAP